MSEFLFGVGHGKVSETKAKKVDKIAKKHDASFITATIPGSGPKYWFSGPNYGAPFDGAMAKAVFADLEAVGIKLP